MWRTVSTPDYAEGVNNLFHAKAKTQMAMDYSYTAVMEQMHLSKTINFLNTKAGYMMASLTPAEKDRARKIIFKAILSTDMVPISKQFRLVTSNMLINYEIELEITCPFRPDIPLQFRRV